MLVGGIRWIAGVKDRPTPLADKVFALIGAGIMGTIFYQLWKHDILTGSMIFKIVSGEIR